MMIDGREFGCGNEVFGFCKRPSLICLHSLLCGGGDLLIVSFGIIEQYSYADAKVPIKL